MWQEEEEQTHSVYADSAAMVDLAFQLQCAALPVDHMFALSTAMQAYLPWFTEEALAGLHLVHIPESGNGWMRPDTPDAMFYPSKRTRLTLRLPRARVDDARQALQGARLDLCGCAVQLGDAMAKTLSTESVLFCRYVAVAQDLEEADFLHWAQTALHALDIRYRKLLPSKTMYFQGEMPDQRQLTRGLMVADLDKESALRLQIHGLGPGRKQGCGLFIAHKGITEVRPT